LSFGNNRRYHFSKFQESQLAIGPADDPGTGEFLRGDLKRRIADRRATDEGFDVPTEQYPILLSVVVVLDNPGRAVRGLIEPIIADVSRRVTDFEIVVVDNGSTDESAAEFERLVKPDGLPNVQVYRLIRPVDFEIAAWAGIENALGDFVLVFDVYNEDLSFLDRALEAAAKGIQFVAIRNLAPLHDSLSERVFAAAFRGVFRFMAGVDLAAEGSQCRLISKQVVSYLLQQPKPALKYRALPAIAGFPKVTLTYTGQGTGGRKARFSSKVRRAINLLFAQTIAPLRIASLLAISGAMMNVFYSVYVLVVAIVKKDVAAGWATLSLQQSGMFFLISVVLFILVEYVAQMFVWNLEGPSYYLAGEHTSAVLGRRQRLNIEQGDSVERDRTDAK
jgi:hypothetical protein